MIKDSMKLILAGVAALLVLSGVGLYFGYFGNYYDATVGKQNMNIQRKNFEQSQSYVEGMLQTLAKEKQEYDMTTDPAAKKAILNYVSSTFVSFDASNVTDQGQYNFLMKARGN